MEGLGSSSTSLNNLFSMIPLILEVSDFGVPFINFTWDGIEGHDLLHEWCRDSGSEKTDENIMVHDASVSDIALESQDVTFERWGELPILFDYMMGGKP